MVTSLPTSYPCFVRAVYSWSGEEKRDLGFVEGDVIEVINTGDGNWWMGRLKRNKMVGSFPCNFVEFIETKETKQKKEEEQQQQQQQQSKQRQRQQQQQPSPLPPQQAPLPQPQYQQSMYGQAYQQTLPYPPQYQQPLYQPQPMHDPRMSMGAVGTGRGRGHGRGMESFREPMSPYGPPQPPPQSYSRPMSAYGPRPREEILDDITNALNESYQPAQPEYDSEGSDEDIARERDEDSDLGSDDSDDGPPPVPPPHSHGVKSAGRTPNLERTPSPLRNAISDVMASLEGLEPQEEASRSCSSGSYTAVDDDEPLSRRQSPMKRSSNTTITGYEDPKEPKYASNFDRPQQQPQRGTPRGHNHTMSSFIDHESDEDGDDSKYIPFDPSSYDQVTRNDTSQSISSMKSTSVRSDSTTPTSMSNMSATSAGSLARRKQENASYRSPTPGNGGGTSGSISGPHTITEVPVKLPTEEAQDGKVKSMKKKSGFLRKMFSSSSSGGGGKDNKAKSHDSDNASLTGETKSVKSSKSTRSRFSVKSTMSIKNGLKKVGRATGFASNDLCPSSSSDNMGSSWIETRRDVHRANTITKNERDQRRKKREVEGAGSMQPLEALAMVKGNETLHGVTRGEGKLNPRDQDFTHVDAAIFSMHTWPQLMTPAVFASGRIGRQFQYDIDRLRAVFDFCASKISIETHYDDYYQEDEDEDGEEMGSFSRLMQTKRATSRELAECISAMCEALEIHCEVVRGRLKTPGEIVDRATVPRPNHYWNAVIINDEWRFIDAALASPSFPRRDLAYTFDQSSNVNLFYFLTAPSELIFTHVPLEEMDQHLVPPMNSADALALPLAAPAAFEHNLKLVDFHTGDARMENFEVTEINLAVPHGIDLHAEVVYGADESNPGLAQMYWEKGRRYARIKATIPDNYSQGVLQVYVSEKGQSMAQQTLPLAYSLGITHSGQNAPFEFVLRHPTPHCKRQDIYIVQPQCKKLNTGNSYTFSINQHPSGGITAGSGFSRTKLGIQSPSGKIYKLQRKNDEVLVFGNWQADVKTMEMGNWRGLILADRGNAWSVFAEWYCI